MIDTKDLCRIFKIDYESLPFSEYAYRCVETFVHYYRMKDLYETYVNKKSYHRLHFTTFLYNYEENYDTIQQKEEDIKNIISYLRNQKNQIIHIHMSNYRFFYHDRNVKMYYVTKNLIQHFVTYYEFIYNKIDFTIENENKCVENLLRAHYLFDFIQNQEISQDDAEFDRLMNEKWYSSKEEEKK